MIFKLRIGHTRIVFNIAKVIDILGVNSKLPNGKHILMWDFDDKPLKDVKLALTITQMQFNLPNIYILRSSSPDNYIAYCFDSCSWQMARAIIGSTEYIDENFYKWGIFRRSFTLRVGKKMGTFPKIAHILHSTVEETASIEELRSWVIYETLQKHENQFFMSKEIF